MTTIKKKPRHQQQQQEQQQQQQQQQQYSFLYFSKYLHTHPTLWLSVCRL